MSEEKCGNCFFYLNIDVRNVRCRRYPPTAGMGEFPQVKESSWCGEYVESKGKPKKTVTEKPKVEKPKVDKPKKAKVDKPKKAKTGLFGKEKT